MDADDEQRLRAHIKLCHAMLAQLAGLVDELWQVVADNYHEDPAVKRANECLKNVLATIARATNADQEH